MKIAATIMVLCWAVFVLCMIFDDHGEVPLPLAVVSCTSFAGGFVSTVVCIIFEIWQS